MANDEVSCPAICINFAWKNRRKLKFQSTARSTAVILLKKEDQQLLESLPVDQKQPPVSYHRRRYPSLALATYADGPCHGDPEIWKKQFIIED